MNIVETIKKSTLFHSVDIQTIEALSKECHKKTCAKGRDIFAMGYKADAFFIILEGWVKLYRISKDGVEAIIHVFGPGETFAEAAVFNDTKTYPVNAHALDEVILVEIPRCFFVQKIEEDSRFALRMLGVKSIFSGTTMKSPSSTIRGLFPASARTVDPSAFMIYVSLDWLLMHIRLPFLCMS